MKQAHWAGAILVLAAMVFAITFAMNFLGGGGGEKKEIAVKEGRQLRFHMRPIKGGYVACEADPNKVYHYDFWFENNHQEAVKVGLDRKSCKCSDVNLYVLNEQGRSRLLALAAGMAGRGAEPAHPQWGGLWHVLYVMGTFALDEVARPRVEEGAERRELLKGEESPVEVPAGAVGWVRLSWKGQENEATSAFDAKLWAQDKGANQQTVQAFAAFHKPVRVQPLYELGELRDEDLQSEDRRLNVVCWSSTRENFHLDAAALEGLARVPGSRTFVVGKPVRLTSAQCQKLYDRNNAEKADHSMWGKVASAYRIPLVLKGLAADGKTPFPIGPFRRVVVLKSDKDVEPLRVEVKGRVVGLVDVGSNADGGGLQLGEFSQSKGAKGKVEVQSRVAGLTLELDEERTKKAAPFLRATLVAETRSEDQRQAWTLRVVVPPNEAYGKFPRREDPAYEDSAVYLKAREKGKPERTIRVPVAGEALRG